ncbi:MAG TPA: cob(I)yrinic acid a,c-diamide adenosyltransferase [Thermoanaerobaculia bacterium]|nr:cob(I)yrinic acid a,c-diamide adenosyltransferase [Thermoanaerobaculia bacterium]
MKIYTRVGDRGETSLFGGVKVGKGDLRIECYGTVDELNSWIGLVRTMTSDPDVDGELKRIQSDLFDIGAHLASPEGSIRFAGVEASRIADLENAIDQMETSLAPLKNFILPGGASASASLHVARTVCRRAERRVVSLGDPSDIGGTTIAYLNRLSDYLFVAARFSNQREGVDDVEWKRH